jgi:deazaflavin-dependent oxidoreductase (nitroreductase family)
MAPRLEKAGLAELAVAAVVVGLGVGLRLILRYQPKPLVDATRKVFGRVLNPILLSISDRFGFGTGIQVLHHVGRRTGREYRTPLCVVPTQEGYVVPAAFGPEVDWLANLRATPQAKLTYKGVTYRVTAEVIGRSEAFRLAGGSPGCRCWDEFRIQDYAILRPDGDRVAPTEKPQ